MLSRINIGHILHEVFIWLELLVGAAKHGQVPFESSHMTTEQGKSTPQITFGLSFMKRQFEGGSRGWHGMDFWGNLNGGMRRRWFKLY